MSHERADEVDAIADLVNTLGILHGHPERFHLNKDDAARRLRKLAKDLRGDTATKVHVWKASDQRQSAKEKAVEAFKKRKTAR